MDPYNTIDKYPEPPVSSGQLKWNKAKFVIRVFCTVVELIICGFEGHFLWLFNHNFLDQQYQYTYITVPFLSLAICWSLAEFAMLAWRRSLRKGIAPGAHVGCELFIWMGLCAAGAIRLVGALGATSYYYYGINSGTEFTFIMGLVDSAFIFVLMLLHFTLFTRACVEVDLHRRDKRVQEIVVAMQRMPQAAPNPLSSEAFTRSSSLAQPAPDLLSQDFVQKYNMLMMNWPDPSRGQDQPIPQDNQKVLLDDLLDARLKATRRKPTPPSAKHESAESSEASTSDH